MHDSVTMTLYLKSQVRGMNVCLSSKATAVYERSRNMLLVTNVKWELIYLQLFATQEQRRVTYVCPVVFSPCFIYNESTGLLAHLSLARVSGLPDIPPHGPQLCRLPVFIL